MCVCVCGGVCVCVCGEGVGEVEFLQSKYSLSTLSLSKMILQEQLINAAINFYHLITCSAAFFFLFFFPPVKVGAINSAHMVHNKDNIPTVCRE